MAKLSARERASLPDSSFAYIDSKGNRRLPINDEPHVRNALARFGRVHFEDDEARDRARGRLLNAAKRYGIMPVGFIAGQLRSERGARGMAQLPTGTVTFLLTDIEGSTALVRQLEADYARLLKEMRGEIRGCVRLAGGHSVDTHGDEYFAVFDDATPALHAAIELQRAMREHRWPKRCEVRVRAGLHTGRPALTDSGYVGLSVHTVARICSVAHGGQIVASSHAVTGMDPLPKGVRFLDLGEHKLAGLPKPERLFQIDPPGERGTFPPLRVWTTTTSPGSTA